MRKETRDRYYQIMKDAEKEGVSLHHYCMKHGLPYQTVKRAIYDIKKEEMQVIGIDTDDRAEVEQVRDDDGKILYYSFKIYKTDKPALTGRLDRDEMNLVYRLYSYYGDSLPQRIVSRHFPNYSIVDFKRILRAFNITKASAPFAPHMFEEYTEDELREIQLREKENSFLRKAEEDDIRNTKSLLKKYAQENIRLKEQLQEVSEIKVVIKDEKLKPIYLQTSDEKRNQSINLYLADMHIGATVCTGSVYEDNRNYNTDEIMRRLSICIGQLKSLGKFDTINLILMGDNMDCCGIPNKTVSLTHEMPEQMDPAEQLNAFYKVILWVVKSIVTSNICNKLNVYSVPCGNHTGIFELAANKGVLAQIKVLYHNVNTKLFEKYYGIFQQNGHIIVVCHGKNYAFMKKPMPLYLDNNNKILWYEWLDHEGIKDYGNVHIIKGDLHSDAISSCKRFDYRNVLSLFGSSDYSAYNYSINNVGIGYDMFIGNNILRGTFLVYKPNNKKKND